MWLLLLLACVGTAQARSQQYYDMIGDVMAGRGDYYDVLGVPPDAPVDAIKKAYRRLAATHHPDKSTEADAAERFQLILRAYATLKDDAARVEFDFVRRHGVPIIEQVGHQAQVLTRDIGLFPALLLTLLCVSALHWVVLRDAFQRHVRSVRESDEFVRLRANYLKRAGAADIRALQQAGATFADAQREVAARFDRESLRELEKTAPTWRDSLFVRLAQLPLAYYRRAMRPPAEIELEHAQNRGLSLAEYRDRLGEHVLALHEQGRLQAYIAQVGKPVPVPPSNDDDDDDRKPRAKQAEQSDDDDDEDDDEDENDE